MSQPTWDPEKRRWLLDGQDATAPRRNRRRSVDVIDRPYADDEDGTADPSYRGRAAGSSLGAELTRVGFGTRDPRAVDHDRDVREPVRDGGWALLDPVRPDPLGQDALDRDAIDRYTPVRDAPAEDRPAYRSDAPQLFHTGEFDRIWQDGLAGPGPDGDRDPGNAPGRDSGRDERGVRRPVGRELDPRDDHRSRSTGSAPTDLDTTGTGTSGRRSPAWSADAGRPTPGRRAAPPAPVVDDVLDDRPGPDRFRDRAVPDRAPRPSAAASTPHPSGHDVPGYEPEDLRDTARGFPRPVPRDDRYAPPSHDAYDDDRYDVGDRRADDRHGIADRAHGRADRDGHELGGRRNAGYGYDDRRDTGPTPGPRTRDRYDIDPDVRGHDGAVAGWYGDDRERDEYPIAPAPSRRSRRHGGDRDDAVAEPEAFDADGYSLDGLSRDGYGRDGFDLQGFDRHGYDRDGFDREGFDRDGWPADEYDDEPGHDRRAYDPGHDERGYDDPAGPGHDGSGDRGYGRRENGDRDPRHVETGYDETGYDDYDYEYDDRGYDEAAHDAGDGRDPHAGRDGYGYAPGHGPDGYRPGRRRAPDDDPSQPGPDGTLTGGELPVVEAEPQERPTRASRRAAKSGRRRRWPWVVGAAAVAGAVAVPVTMTLLGGGDEARSDDPPLLSAGAANLGATGSEQSAPAGDAAAQPASAQITYEVSGSGTASSITFGRGTAVAQVADATLPWKQDSPAANGESDYTLSAVSDGGGEISCRILAGGAVIAEQKADGDYAAVSCNGRR